MFKSLYGADEIFNIDKLLKISNPFFLRTRWIDRYDKVQHYSQSILNTKSAIDCQKVTTNTIWQDELLLEIVLFR